MVVGADSAGSQRERGGVVQAENRRLKLAAHNCGQLEGREVGSIVWLFRRKCSMSAC